VKYKDKKTLLHIDQLIPPIKNRSE